MTYTEAGLEESQFAASLGLVKNEIANSLDVAAGQLDLYSETGNADNFRQFLVEIQQVRGTFKMLNFRAGERLCEEFAESGRRSGDEMLSDNALSAFTQGIVYLKRFMEILSSGLAAPPSLLVPSINQIRKVRGDSELPDSYFFLVNLRPEIKAPRQDKGPMAIPYKKACQMFRAGLVGLVKKKLKRKDAIVYMVKVIRRFEYSSRGKPSWLYWYAVSAGVEALAQPVFELSPSRVKLLTILDKQLQKVAASDGAALAEKQPDWLLKEFVFLASLAEPASVMIKSVHRVFKLESRPREKDLNDFRDKLSGPDQAALESLASALREELQKIKDQIDLAGQIEISVQDYERLLASLYRIGETLIMTNQKKAGENALELHRILSEAGHAGISHVTSAVADRLISLEQSLMAISSQGLDFQSSVDPVILNEAWVLSLAESISALGLVKRAVGSYLESGGEVLHIKNVSKSLKDVSGALYFLDKPEAREIVVELDRFVVQKVLPSTEPVSDSKMESLADAITAVEYFISSLKDKSGSAKEAIELANTSLNHLWS